MTRRACFSLMCLAISFPIFARAADPLKDAFARIPEDAIGFVCLPNLKQLDSEWQQAITSYGLQALVQPPWNSPLAILKQFTQISDGLMTTGPLIFVQMPAENAADLGKRSAVYVPANDPKALVEALGGKAGEGNLWNITIVGQPAFARTGDKCVVIGDSADGVKAVGEAKAGMDAKLKDLTAFEGLDLIVWVDGDRLLKILKPQIDMFTGMIAMAQAAGGPLGVKQAESTKKQIDMFISGAQSVLMGLSLDPAGLGMRFALNVKPGSELAKQVKVTPPSGSLLAGLPAGRFMLVFGQVLNPDSAREALKQIEPYFEAGKDVASINAEQLGVLKSTLEEWAPLTTAVRASVEALPSGPGGLIGASVIFDTTDSAKWLEAIGKVVEAAKKISTDKEVLQVAGAVSFAPAAEDIAGKKVAELKLDLSKIEDADEDDIEELGKVLGKEGVLFRLAAVSPQRVVATFGGGVDYAKRLIEQAQKDDAPLDNAPGIQKVGKNLPKKPVAAGYLAVDQIVACIENVAKALEEDEPLPFRMPEINAPAAMSSTVEKESMRVDLFLPTELVVAVKDVALTMMGAGPPGAAPAQPAGDPGKKGE